jgi:hypothetical protein
VKEERKPQYLSYEKNLHFACDNGAIGCVKRSELN